MPMTALSALFMELDDVYLSINFPATNPSQNFNPDLARGQALGIPSVQALS